MNLRWGLSYFTEEKSELAKSINFKKIFLSIFLIFFLSVLGTPSPKFGDAVPNFDFGDMGAR